MAEILLSFFAVIGMLFLLIYFCDYLFYRSFSQKMTLTVDTRNRTEEDCMEIFELITSLRQMTIGKAALNHIIILVSDLDDNHAKLAYEYIRVFKLPGEVREEKNS